MSCEDLDCFVFFTKHDEGFIIIITIIIPSQIEYFQWIWSVHNYLLWKTDFFLLLIKAWGKNRGIELNILYDRI